MKKQIIIHSHFYQPPRENPNTLKIETEYSAMPFNNWNERITAECYRANSASRYLDETNHIKKIINNYEFMSFNIGPTLLSFLEKNYKQVAERIKEADRISVEKYTEGNAIAQSYNHTILPLDDEDFARSQIRGDLYAFKKFFSRDSKGFWCPECAISKSVIDILFEEGVQFTVLSPLQIEKLKIGNEIIERDKIEPKHLCRPFWIKGKKHKIAAFFYNKDLSSEISFNHLLRDANNFYSRIKNIADNGSDVVIAATDGEIYGHHEPFGDMAFAALTEKVKERKEFTFTNFATFLKQHPPKDEAILIEGEDNKGSSWSCSHGVSRWYKDCGCHTGGGENWNQKWRTPLRRALNSAKREVTQNVENILCQKGKGYSLLDFVEILDKDKNLDKDVKNALLAYKWMSYSFTSCAWFFSDISGIETIHNIGYMIKALDMLSMNDTKQKFINSLKSAKSNVNTMRDGKTIAERIIDVYFKPKSSDEIMEAITKNGINKENTITLLDSITIRGLSPNSGEYFETQNAVYEAIKNKRYEKSNELVILLEVLNISKSVFR